MSVGMMASNIQSYEAIRSFTSSMTVVSLIDLPFFVLFLAVICIISWVFVIPLVIAAIIILLYALSVHISLKKLSDAMSEASQQRQGLLIETLNNQETIKSFNAAGRMQTLWEKATRFTVQYSSKLRFIGGTVGNFAGWVQQTAGVVIILVGVYLIVDGKLHTRRTDCLLFIINPCLGSNCTNCRFINPILSGIQCLKYAESNC